MASGDVPMLTTTPLGKVVAMHFFFKVPMARRCVVKTKTCNNKYFCLFSRAVKTDQCNPCWCTKLALANIFTRWSIIQPWTHHSVSTLGPRRCVPNYSSTRREEDGEGTIILDAATRRTILGRDALTNEYGCGRWPWRQQEQISLGTGTVGAPATHTIRGQERQAVETQASRWQLQVQECNMEKQ